MHETVLVDELNDETEAKRELALAQNEQNGHHPRPLSKGPPPCGKPDDPVTRHGTR